MRGKHEPTTQRAMQTCHFGIVKKQEPARSRGKMIVSESDPAFYYTYFQSAWASCIFKYSTARLLGYLNSQRKLLK